MERWAGKVAVVTGASAGIGAAISRALVKNGLIVVGLARRKDRVLELANELNESSGKLHALECDLTKEEDILEAFEWMKNRWGGIDVLVNNAGIVKSSTLTGGSTQDWRQTFDLNVLAVCICTREAVKLMEGRDQGHIINIGSVASHRIPSLIPAYLNVYPASKHALRVISDTLRIECTRDKKKIKVTTLSPGSVHTEIGENLGKSGTPLSEEDIKELMRHTVALQPEDVAAVLLSVLGTPQHVEIRELIVEPMGSTL